MKPSAYLRLFVALYPPREAAALLLEAASRAVGERARLPAPEQLHLTVHFIGDTPMRAMDDVRESVARSASGIGLIEMRVNGLIELPDRGVPRLLAARLDASPGLFELQRRLVHRLARSPRGRDGEHFLPHITLARYAPGSAAPRLTDLPPVESPTFLVDHVRLVRSVLRPGGSEHIETSRARLSS